MIVKKKKDLPSELRQFQAGEDGMSIICVVSNEGQPS